MNGSLLVLIGLISHPFCPQGDTGFPRTMFFTESIRCIAANPLNSSQICIVGMGDKIKLIDLKNGKIKEYNHYGYIAAYNERGNEICIISSGKQTAGSDYTIISIDNGDIIEKGTTQSKIMKLIWAGLFLAIDDDGHCQSIGTKTVFNALPINKTGPYSCITYDKESMTVCAISPTKFYRYSKTGNNQLSAIPVKLEGSVLSINSVNNVASMIDSQGVLCALARDKEVAEYSNINLNKAIEIARICDVKAIAYIANNTVNVYDYTTKRNIGAPIENDVKNMYYKDVYYDPITSYVVYAGVDSVREVGVLVVKAIAK